MALTETVLAGIALNEIINRFRSLRKNNIILPSIFLAIVIFNILASGLPIFTGNLMNELRLYKVAPDYKSMYEFFEKDPGYYRVLLIPSMNAFKPRNSSLGLATGNDFMIYWFPKPALLLYSSSGITNRFFLKILFELLNNKSELDIPRILAYLGVKYVIVRSDIESLTHIKSRMVKFNDIRNLIEKQNNVTYVVNVLTSKGFRIVNKTRDFIILENPLWRPNWMFDFARSIIASSTLSLNNYLKLIEKNNRTIVINPLSLQIAEGNTIHMVKENSLDLLLVFNKSGIINVRLAEDSLTDDAKKGWSPTQYYSFLPEVLDCPCEQGILILKPEYGSIIDAIKGSKLNIYHEINFGRNRAINITAIDRNTIKYYKFYIDNKSNALVIESKAPPRTWSNIVLPDVSVKPGCYVIESLVKFENTTLSHINDFAYDMRSRKWVYLESTPQGSSGTRDWFKYRDFVCIKPHIKKIRFIIKHGWPLDEAKVARMYVKYIRMYYVDNSRIQENATWVFSVSQKGHYMVALLALKGPKCGMIRVCIDDSLCRDLVTYDEESKYSWIFLNIGNISSGTHRLLLGNVYGNINLVCRIILFPYSYNKYITKTSSSQNPHNYHAPNLVNYLRSSSTLWTLSVKSKSPFVLVFKEAYDPLWEARVYKNGRLAEIVRSIPVYGVINGFWINETGNLTIVIRYVPQDWFELGLKISTTTFILCIFYLVWDWRRSRGDRWALWLERCVRSIPRHLKGVVMRVLS